MSFEVNIPFVLSYQFADVPVEMVLEIAPLLDLNPEIEGVGRWSIRRENLY